MGRGNISAATIAEDLGRVIRATETPDVSIKVLANGNILVAVASGGLSTNFTANGSDLDAGRQAFTDKFIAPLAPLFAA